MSSNSLKCGVTCAFAVSASVLGATPYWANWDLVNPNGSISGTLATDAGPVWLAYAGEIQSVQLNNTGFNYFGAVPAPYISAGCESAPAIADAISIAGGAASGEHTVYFWPSTKDPIMAIAGMGRAGFPVSYQFNAPFAVLSSGPGFFGGPGTLVDEGANVLTGENGHGVIRFIGTFFAIRWTATDASAPQWFTVGATGAVVSCPCDLNYDNVVDDADFVLFAPAYNILDCFDPMMPAFCPADFNYDTAVDDADFVIFAAAYDELVCP